MSKYVLPEVRELKAYVPGTQPLGEGWIKLNTNENPYPPSPAVIGAIATELGPPLRLYPHPAAGELKVLAADAYGVTPDQVFAGNGSDDVLHQLVRACVPVGGSIVAITPCYGLYGVLAAARGAALISVPYTEGFGLPPCDACPDAPLTFLTNPNSPTGVSIGPEAIAEFAAALPGVLVVDEAYADFADSNCTGLVGQVENLVVARTFSKSYSLAGMRLGLALGPAPIVAALDALRDAYNVNRLALAAGSAALRDRAAMQANATKIKATRERIRTALESAGLFVYPSQANFLLVRIGDEVQQVFEALAEQKILVRWLDHPRIVDCLRISIGTDYEMDRLLDALLTLVD